MASSVSGATTGTIQVGGLVSGLDTQGIIDKLVALEKQPITLLQTRQKDYTVQLTAYGLMENKLKALQTAAKAMDDAWDFNAFSSSSSDESIFTATASSSTAPGAYDVSVTQVAKSQKLTSTAFGGSDTVAQFTVNAGNKYINFKENGGPELTATLTEGTYSISDLVEELHNQLNAASAAGGNNYSYDITYNANTKGFTIQSSSAGLTQLDMLWATGTNTVNSAASLMGYDVSDDTGGLAYFSDTEVGEGTLHIETGNTFTISSSNNKINFKENTGSGLGAELTATIADGTYTVKQLETAMKSALQTASTAGGNSVNYTVSFDPATRKFSVAENGSTLTELQFLWNSGANASNSAGSTLGFSSADNTGAVAYTANNATATVVDVAVKATDTLSDVAKAINTSTAAVTARVIYDGSKYFLALSSDNTGEKNTITITATDTDGSNTNTVGLSRLVFDAGVTQNLTQIQGAQDAILSVDGISGIKRASNTISDVITGVTLTLKKAHANPLTESDSVTVSRDTTAISKKVTAFVDAYNAVLDFFSEYQKKYDKTANTAGVLVGDSTTNQIRNTIRKQVNATISGITSMSRLADIGVALNQEADPRLEVDSTTLNTMLDSHFEDVRSFFSQKTSGAEGLASRIVGSLNGVLDTYDGMLTARKEGVTATIGKLDKKIQSLTDALDTTQANLWKRFNSLEVLLANFKNTGDYLTQQITGLSNLSKSIQG